MGAICLPLYGSFRVCHFSLIYCKLYLQMLCGMFSFTYDNALGSEEEEEVIYIGQGYRYALRDQDAFCLV